MIYVFWLFAIDNLLRAFFSIAVCWVPLRLEMQQIPVRVVIFCCSLVLVNFSHMIQSTYTGSGVIIHENALMVEIFVIIIYRSAGSWTELFYVLICE